MLRWNDVDDKEVFDMTIKMYRNPFVPSKKIKSVLKNVELDHHAYKYLGSEVFMYKILDTNFIRYMEERGDLSRIKDIYIPVDEDLSQTIL